MSFDLRVSAPHSRFAWILRGATRGPDASFDEDLGSYPEAAIIPTQGALVPEWLLVVPRKPCLSVAVMGSQMRGRLLTIADEVSAKVSELAGACVMFEHGPRKHGIAAGCGVDQAHLHIVGGSLHLLDRMVERVDEAEWSSVDRIDPWSVLPPDSDYLLILDRRRALLATVANPASQRFRQALAEVLGCPKEWDYKLYPNAANARRTKELFHGAFPNVT